MVTSRTGLVMPSARCAIRKWGFVQQGHPPSTIQKTQHTVSLTRWMALDIVCFVGYYLGRFTSETTSYFPSLSCRKGGIGTMNTRAEVIAIPENRTEHSFQQKAWLRVRSQLANPYLSVGVLGLIAVAASAVWFVQGESWWLPLCAALSAVSGGRGEENEAGARDAQDRGKPFLSFRHDFPPMFHSPRTSDAPP